MTGKQFRPTDPGRTWTSNVTFSRSGASKKIMKHFLPKACPIVISIALAMLLGACSTPTSSHAKREPLQEIPHRIQKGVTSKSSVIATLGEPKGKELYPTGERWLYGSAANRRSTANAVGEQLLSTGIGMIPYAGGAINGLRSIARVSSATKPGATIDFDRRGIVQDYSVALN